MELQVNLHYIVAEGQRLAVRHGASRVAMKSSGDGWWSGVLCDVSGEVEYSFEVVQGRKTVRREWGDVHRVVLPHEVGRVVVIDAWSEEPTMRAAYTSLFTKAVFAHDVEAAPRMCGHDIYIEVEAPMIRREERLSLVGSTAALGAWLAPQPMAHIGGGRWAAVVPFEAAEYKFVVTDGEQRILRWERGENRRLFPSVPMTIVRGLRLRDGVSWRGAGVAVPVFALRSEHSFGVGEFADLRLLVDWCVAAGQNVIQLLPVNDTTMSGSWEDSYPYNAISIYALHPLYLRLSDVGYLRGEAERQAMEAECQALNALPQMDYEGVMRAKMHYLRLLYSQLGERCMASKSFRDFKKSNYAWLMPYAVFSVLRDRYHTADFEQWPTFSHYNEKRCAAFAERNAAEVGFYFYLQYHLDRQLRAVRDYAHAHGVALKGDIPIGVNRTSVETWSSPELFVMDSSAGAPPDDFSRTGQNWGFPIYNWARMAEDGYAWWRSRFAKMSDYFDAYRIDHILGFFRIWEVPLDAVNALVGEFNPLLPYSEAEIRAAGFDFDAQRDVAHDYSTDDVLWLEYRHGEGYYPRITPFDTPSFKALDAAQQCAFAKLHDEFYYRRHNEFWSAVAVERLRTLLDATPMLACGEDLGMIPQCVPDVMSAEQILSLEVERMPKEYGVATADVMRYPYLSVATTSTHDMAPLRLWWEESFESSQRYYNEVLGCEGEAPRVADEALCRRIVERHLASPSMLAVLPLQDWLSMSAELRSADPASERINIPAKARHYWRYRMHITLERLLADEEFSDTVRQIVERSRRG